MKKKSKEPITLSKAFILGDGSIVSETDLMRVANGKVGLKKAGIAIGGDDDVEVPDREIGSYAALAVDPPYEPSLLARFLELDEVHARCVAVKVTDAVGRGYFFDELDPAQKTDAAVLKLEKAILKEFIGNCNRYDKFLGVLEQAAQHFEGVGYGCIEVIRSMDMQIVALNHVPSDKVRVLEGYRGFVDLSDGDTSKTFYQNFGEKVVSKIRRDIRGRALPFDITKDKTWANAEWSLRERSTFFKSSNLSESASELLYIPKWHPRSEYYGIPDFIPAIGHILANLNIRDFFLQFFDHNTVPQYAVIIKGANVSDEVKSLIMTYFNRDVKGASHKTLVIPIPAAGGEVEVVFEKLENQIDTDGYEKTRKANQVAIMVAHGVSPAIIGIADTAELGAGKGQSQMENYVERIVIPTQRRWQDEVNNMFRLGLGVQHVGLLFDHLTLKDDADALKQDTEAMEKGLLTLNDVRKRNALGDPVEGGDRLFIMTTGGPMFVDELSGDKYDDLLTGLEAVPTAQAKSPTK